MSTLAVNTLQAQTGSNVAVASGHSLTGTAGSIAVPGSVIQVQHSSFANQMSSASGTQAATGMAMNFTPHKANSKLLCRLVIGGVHNGSASSGWNLYLYRDGSGITESGLDTASGHEGRFHYAVAYNTGGASIMEVSCEVLLSANSTSQTNIALWGSRYGSGTSYINVNNGAGDRSFMTIMEIAQ